LRPGGLKSDLCNAICKATSMPVHEPTRNNL
jgi:hypothetical protein